MLWCRALLASSFALALVVAGGLPGCSSSSGANGAGGDGAGGDGTTAGSSGSSGSSGTDPSATPSTDADGGTSTTPPSGGSGAALTPGTTTITISAAGKSRSVLLVVPPAAASQALPLVIGLHGDGDTSEGFVTQTTDLASLAASKGFVLAAPQGVTQTITIGAQTITVDWDAYRSVAQGNIDLPLIDAIRAQLTASASIDSKRVFSFGYSQGGYMSFTYGMVTAASVSCAGVVAAADPLGGQLVAGAARKVPFALQIGTSDGAISQARATKTELTNAGFPLDYHEIAGAGHVPPPGDLGVPLAYCLGQSL